MNFFYGHLSWRSFTLALLLLFLVTVGERAQAQGPGATATTINLGDAAVSGFSGAKLATEGLPPGTDPVDKTIIDVDGASLRVFDLTALGGPPAGQIVDAPPKLDVKARDIGQVFGLVFDDGTAGGPPNLYVAATSAYGIQLVGPQTDRDGTPIRLKQGAPGARFMDGLFGGLRGASPGSIWKIDGTTGAVTLFADTAFSGTANSGPGLGNLAFDSQSRSLYVSDLDTGLIHRFDPNANYLGRFDHGVNGRPARNLPAVADDGRGMDISSPGFRPEDVGTWGMTQPERRVHGLAVHRGRLYYGVAQGPEVWSVGLNADGSFGSDVRFEVAVEAGRPLPVTDIVFDSQGRMTLALRGALSNTYDYSQLAEPNTAQVLRYVLEQPDNPATPGRWALAPQSYAVGFAGDQRNGSGGISLQFGYGPDGRIDYGACERTLMTTGDALPANGIGYGVQISSSDLVRPANVPPQQSAFLPYGERQVEADARGYVGDVQVFQRCDVQRADAPGYALPPVAGLAPPAGFPPVVDGGAPADAFPPVVDGLPPPVGGDGGLQVEKRATVARCSDKGGCSFEVTVSNKGDVPVRGPVVISDDISSAKATITAGPNAPWTCTKAPPFRCTHPGPIPARQNVPLQLTFAPETGGAKEVRNCAILASAQPGPAPAPGQPLPPVVDVPPATEKEFDGLRVSKKPVSGKCTVGAGGCQWEITVTNISAAALTGTLGFDDNISLRDTATDKAVNAADITLESTTSTPSLTCKKSKGDQFDCRGDQITLAPNQSFTFKYSLKIAAPADASATLVQNTLFLSFAGKAPVASAAAFSSMRLDPPLAAGQPAPNGGGALPAGQGQPPAESCATIPLDQSDQPPPGQAQSGPLKVVKKVITTPCTLDGGCTFEIGVLNASATPFTGGIVISDNTKAVGGVFGAPEITSVNPAPGPFGCSGPGKTQSIECSNPTAKLGPNEQGTFRVTFKPGPGTTATAVENCVLVRPAQGAFTSPACVTVPISAQPGQTPPPAPAGQAQLKIEKKATVTTCTAEGGGCDFEVTVTNPGPGDVAGPIEIDDAVTAGGAAIATTQLAAVPGAPWTCLHKGQGAFSCTHPGPLKAGASTKLKLATWLNASTKATHIRNCAVLKGSNAQACAEILLSQAGPNEASLRPEKTLVSGDCSKSCEFLIMVRNVGKGTFSGDITVSDFLTASGGLSEPFQLISAGPGWSCNMTAQQFADCKRNNVTLQVGGSLALRLTIKINKLSFEGQNCSRVLTAPTNQGDNDQAGRCAPVSITLPPVVAQIPGPIIAQALQPSLKVEKQAPNADGPGGQGHCSVNGPCRFQITVTNTGPVDFSGFVRIRDNVSGGTPESISQGPGSPPGWNCSTTSGTAQLSCGFGFMTIRRGDSLRLEVAATPGKTWVNPQTNLLTNCAQVHFTPFNEKNEQQPDKVGNESCATAKLDPFAVSVTKTGDQSCQPGGLCRFDIDVFNNGQIPHDDPVTVIDGLSGIGPAQIVAITGALPFPCTPQPTQIPFNCTSPGNFPLSVGEHKRYTMTVRMPAAAAGTSFVNCIAVSSPQAAVAEERRTRQTPAATPARATGPAPGAAGAGGGESSDCHSVKLEPAGTTPATPLPIPLPPLTPPPPSAQSCFGGMVMTGDGRCVCPPGTDWSGRRCIASAPPPPISSGGFDTSKSPGSESRPECPRGQVWQGGRCVLIGGDRRPECPPNRPNGTPPNCCPLGTTYERGACRATTAEQSARCAPTMIGTPPNCRCPDGTEFTRGACRPATCPLGMTGTPPNCCPPGTRYVNGACERPQAPQQQCSRGMVGTPPNCECPPGTRFSRYGRRCTPIQQAPTQTTPPPQQQCSRGMVGTPPNCSCPPGTRYLPYGRRCVKTTTQTPPPVPKDKGPVQQLKCPSYQIGTYPNCRCPPRLKGPKCDQPIVN